MIEFFGTPLNVAPKDGTPFIMPWSWQGCNPGLIQTEQGPPGLVRGPGSSQMGSSVSLHCFQKEVGFLEKGK